MYGAALEQGPGRPDRRRARADDLDGHRRRSSRRRSTSPQTGQTLTIDGVEIVFQVTPGTEAPAEMNFYFPDHRALCTAENTSHTLHNILTLRGALVRDAARVGALPDRDDRPVGRRARRGVRLAPLADAGAASAAVEFLAMQRDMYLYLHDQTLRLINQGYIGAEIAEMLEMPPALERAVAHPRLLRLGEPQRQGDLPALHGLVRRQPGQPVAAPARGGRRAVRRRHGRRATPRSAVARRAFDEGDYRWCAEVGKHLVFADDTNDDGARAAGRRLRAARLRRRERHVAQRLPRGARRSCARATSARPCHRRGRSARRADRVEQVFDSIAIRIDGPRAWDEHLAHRLATSPTRARPTSPSSATGCSTTGRWRPAPAGVDDVHAHPARAHRARHRARSTSATALCDGAVDVDGDPRVARPARRPARPGRPGLRDRHAVGRNPVTESRTRWRPCARSIGPARSSLPESVRWVLRARSRRRDRPRSLQTPRAAGVAGVLFALLFGVIVVLFRRVVPLDPQSAGPG